jgi:hypothetical protein
MPFAVLYAKDGPLNLKPSLHCIYFHQIVPYHYLTCLRMRWTSTADFEFLMTADQIQNCCPWMYGNRIFLSHRSLEFLIVDNIFLIRPVKIVIKVLACDNILVNFLFFLRALAFLSHSRRKPYPGNSSLSSPRRRVLKHLHGLWKGSIECSVSHTART